MTVARCQRTEFGIFLIKLNTALCRLPSILYLPYGGGERDRTDDLLRARQALSQLSYTPKI